MMRSCFLALGVVILLVGVQVGCRTEGLTFSCTTAAQCGTGGQCVDGACAFPGDCPSGLRYDSSAGPLAGQCVPPDMGDADNGTAAGSDGPSEGDMAVSPPEDLSGVDLSPPATYNFTVTTIPDSKCPNSTTTPKCFFTGVWGTGSDNVFVVGAGGTVLRSTDGGATWSAISTPQSNMYWSVWADGPRVWSLGEAFGATSSDSGATFSVNVSPSTQTLYHVFGFDPSNIFAVGASGTIIHTTNGGTSWAPPPSPPPSTVVYYSVWGSSPNDLYVVGESGTIFRSANNGSSWAAPTDKDGVTADLYGVGGSAGDVYVVGLSGAVLRSTDNGATFKFLPSGSPTANALSGVWASGIGNVFICGANGYIGRSQNTGATWTQVANGLTTRGLGAIWGPSPAEVYAVGGNVIIHGK